MPRKQIYIDEGTAQRLLALTRSDLARPLYASDSEAIRIAVERLWCSHFNPASYAADEVLERTRQHIRAALNTVEWELARRAEERDAAGEPE